MRTFVNSTLSNKTSLDGKYSVEINRIVKGRDFTGRSLAHHWGMGSSKRLTILMAETSDWRPQKMQDLLDEMTGDVCIGGMGLNNILDSIKDLAEFSTSKIDVIEIESSVIEVADNGQENSNISFVNADFITWGGNGNTYDIVLCDICYSQEYWDSIKDAVEANYAPLLKSGGKVIGFFKPL